MVNMSRPVMKTSATVNSDAFLRIRIDKSSPVPAYAQIGDALKNLLRTGAIPAGTPLPPERVLCENLGVSRMTLRQACDALERDGLIESHRGRGTFVAPRRIQKKQQEMRSFTEEIRSRGQTPSSRLLVFRSIKQSTTDRDFFGLPESELIYELERVRLADDVPIAIERIHIPEYLCPNLDRFNLASHSIYKILEENYGLTLAHCTEHISAAWPSKAHKQLLQTPPNGVVLVVNRRTYTNKETPIELATTTYRGDLFTAVVYSVRSAS
jgi:GntR family transcriptional regulator